MRSSSSEEVFEPEKVSMTEYTYTRIILSSFVLFPSNPPNLVYRLDFTTTASIDPAVGRVPPGVRVSVLPAGADSEIGPGFRDARQGQILVANDELRRTRNDKLR